MKINHKIARLGGIIGAALLLTTGAAILLMGCGGGSGGGGKAGRSATMLVLGSTSRPEYAALQGTYSAVPTQGAGDDPTKHRLVAVGCNSFAPEDLAKNVTIRSAFAHKIPVTFFDMTEAHKKALMLPRMGIATAGDSPAVTLIPGKYASMTEPGIIIEGKTLIAINKTITDLPTKPQSLTAGKATPATAAGRAAGMAVAQQVTADPQWYADKVREVIENRGATRQVGDSNDDGAYTPPTGAKYFHVLLIGGGSPSLTLQDKQTMAFNLAWNIYVFDDLGSDGNSRARKILITTVGQSQARTSATYARNKNGAVEDSDVGYWLGQVTQNVNLRTDNAADDTLDLITSSPNSTQRTTSYTTSVGANIGVEVGAEGASPTGSFTIGSSTTTDVLKWVVLQTLEAAPENNHLRSSVSHTWMQNDPFNLLLSGGNDSSGPFDFFDPTYNHLGDLPNYSNGSASLYTKSAAVYQAAPDAGVVELNPVFKASMYRYYETGAYNPHLEEQDFVYSPGVLQIDTNAVDNNVQIESITWDSSSNGLWVIPYNTGVTNGASVTVRLNRAVAQDTPVTLTHYTDPNTTTQFGGAIGVTFTPFLAEPDGTSKTFTVSANTNFVSVPISATAANDANNPSKTPFFAWIVGNVGGAQGQEVTSKILITSQ